MYNILKALGIDTQEEHLNKKIEESKSKIEALQLSEAKLMGYNTYQEYKANYVAPSQEVLDYAQAYVNSLKNQYK